MEMTNLYKWTYDKFVVHKASDTNIIEHNVNPKRVKWDIESVAEVNTDVLKKVYGDLLYKVTANNVTFVCDSNDDKVSLKIYSTVRRRGFGIRYFKVRREIVFVTYNFKTNNLYCGNILKSNKRTIQKKIYCNKFGEVGLQRHMLMFHNIIKDCVQNKNPNPFFIQTELIEKVGDEPKEKSILLEGIKAFFDKIMDKTQVELKYDSRLQSQFFKLYLKKNDVKYHDMINDYLEWSLPKKLLKKHKNYVDAFMDYYKFNGKKIKKYMNQIPKIDWFNLSWAYRTLGIDYFNKIDKNFFKQNNNSAYYLTNNLFNNPDKLTNFEKSKVVDAINFEVPLSTIIDHLQTIKKLKEKYNHEFKMRFTNLSSFNSEHYRISELYTSYIKGIVVRSYGDFAEEQISESIMGFNIDYFPVVLKTTGEFNEESQHQQNCVRTYSEKPNCIIISLRAGSHNSNERATIEYRFRRNEMIRTQSLGKFNRGLETSWDLPLEILDKRVKSLWSKKTLTLPRMKKETMNGKLIKQYVSMFDEKNPIRVEPIWDEEVDYNGDENLFLDFVG
jgi:hypothetical protein